MGVVYKNVEKIAAHMCKGELLIEAGEQALLASAALATHRDKGESRITVSQGKLDAFVNLDDKAAESIEFGHWTDPDRSGGERKYVPGLSILRRLL